jgi:CheY-like chemotaxis protein
MNNKPIIIIDDDDEDLELIKDAFSKLNIENEIIIFNDGFKFLDYIRKTKNLALFTLCDINMAKIDGLELKKLIYDDEELRLKCVPFIFMSTSSASRSVMKAYSYGVQGYFVKPASFEQLTEMLQFIVKYWSRSEHPIILENSN